MPKSRETLFKEDCFRSIFTQETNSAGRRSNPEKRKSTEQDTKNKDDSQTGKIAANKKITYDSISPTKSPMDKNCYKIIRFPNNLRACLISQLDHTPPDSLESIDPTTFCFQEVQEFNERYVQMHQNLGPDPDDMSLLEKATYFPWYESVDEITDDDPPGDEDCEPAIKKLKTELPPNNTKEECCDPDFGISICVTAGSLHDPKEFAGMAHLCEHCIFEGTQKYPNSWNLLQENTLHVNAYTGKERTVYYAHTENLEKLRVVTGILADMIMNPLLTDDIISREILSVDSESSIRQSNDIIRLFDLFTYLAKTSHPLRRYHAGDASTLGKVNIAKELRKWHKQYYQPHNIIVSIQGPLLMSELIRLVGENFYAFKSSKRPNSPSNEIHRFGFPFQGATYNKVYKVCPFEDIQWLLVSWTLPHDIWRNHATKPLEYIVTLLRRQGPGSLHDYLMRQNFITDSTCCCTHPGNSYVKTRLYSSIVVLFEVTDKGFNHSRDIILALFSYLKKIQKIGPKRRIFDEIRIKRAHKFHFGNAVPDFTFAGVSLHINEHCPCNILTAPALVTKYDPKIIQECLMQLQPGNMNVMVMSKKFEKDIAQVHPNILTEFGAFCIHPDLLESIEKCWDYEGNFSLPSRNQFILEDCCHPMEYCVGNLPTLVCLSYLYSSGRASLVCSHERTPIGTPPTAIYTFMFTSSSSPTSNYESSVCSKLWVKILMENFNSKFCDALDSGLKLGVNINDNGIFMYLYGLSRFLPQIWLQMLNDFSNFQVHEQLFEDFKQLEIKSYGNNLLNPMYVAQDVLLYLTSTRHSLQGTLQLFAHTSVTYDSFLKWTKKFKSRMWICAQLFGSVTNEQLETVSKSLAELEYNPLVSTEIFSNHCYIIPPGEKCLRIKSISPKCYTSFVVNYYQLGNLSLQEVAACHLMAQELSSYIFDELRSRQQIGYLVWTIFDESYSVSSLKVCIRFQADRFSPGYVDEKIDEAFISFYEKYVKKDKDLTKLLKKRCGTTSAKKYGKVVTEFAQKLKKKLNGNGEAVTNDLKKFRRFYSMHFPIQRISRKPDNAGDDAEETMQKLSVQVAGAKRFPNSCPLRAELEDIKIQRYDRGNPLREPQTNLPFLNLDVPKDVLAENGYFLTDLVSFRNQLCLYPNCSSNDDISS